MSNKRILESNTFSNLIAIVALILSAGTCIYTCNENRKAEIENLQITSDKVLVNQNVKLIDGFYLIMPSFWSCILTNNGLRNLSINQYDIKCLANGENLIHYTNIDLGIYDSKLDKIDMPINIAPGESRKIFIQVGVRLGEKASSIIKENMNIDSLQSINRIKVLLADKNMDYFDNKVEAFVQDNKVVTMEWEDMNINKDYYGLTLTSGKNKNFVDILKWYPTLNDLK